MSAGVHIALLRGINVGGHKMVAMADLCALATRLGLADARTLLQSGNLVFQSSKSGDLLECLLETEIKKRFALETDFFVRSADQWRSMVAHNPFRDEATRDPGHLLVMLCKDTPDRKDVKALQAAITGPEVVRADGTHAYITYPDGVGRSRLTTALIERKLGTRVTGRNWNTVLKLDVLAHA